MLPNTLVRQPHLGTMATKILKKKNELAGPTSDPTELSRLGRVQHREVA
jgi:hypothetical protein